VKVGILALSIALAGSSVAVEPPPEQRYAFRADHMVLDAALSGSLVLVGTQSGRVDRFDWREGGEAQPLHATVMVEGGVFPPTVTAVAVSPSGALCAIVSSDGALEVFPFGEAGLGEPVVRIHRPDLLSARFLSDERVLVGDRRGELALVDVASGRELYRRKLEYDPIYALAPSPDGRRVAVAFRSSRIQVLAAVSGQTQQILKGHRDSVYGLAWLDDDTLVSGGKDKHVLRWSLAQQGARPEVVFAADHYVTALGVDRSAGLLAIPLADFQVGLLRLSDGRILRRFAGHTGPLQSLLFTADGETLISAGNDARIFVWDLADESKGEAQ
jgi:WD40 repeat protein